MLFEDAERGLNDDLRLEFEVLATMSLEEQTFAKDALDSMVITSRATDAPAAGERFGRQCD